MALLDITLSNPRQFYSSMDKGEPLRGERVKKTNSYE